ncbi:hypothetical protein MD484_g3725, partial [Candolleomyces efflorescens]
MSEQRKQDDHGGRLIAVMGETGAGKSWFINAVLGRQEALVDGGSCSCTKTVEKYEYIREDGLTLALVDTPGFEYFTEEDARTDAEILQMVAGFLKARYGEERKFSGIVFLHPINTAPGNSASKNMRMLKLLCGSDRLKNVVVVTTRWDEVCNTEEVLMKAGNSERVLMESKGLLKELSDVGVPFLRSGHFSDKAPQPVGDQYQTPLAVVESLLGLEPVYLQLQEEIAEGKSIQETAAGLFLEKELNDLKSTLNERMNDIYKDLKSLETNTDPGGAEQGKQDDILHARITEWRSLQQQFMTQWKAWEATRKKGTGYPAKVDREQELKSARLLHQLNTELKQGLKTSQKETNEIFTEYHTLQMRDRQLKEELEKARLQTIEAQTKLYREQERGPQGATSGGSIIKLKVPPRKSKDPKLSRDYTSKRDHERELLQKLSAVTQERDELLKRCELQASQVMEYVKPVIEQCFREQGARSPNLTFLMGPDNNLNIRLVGGSHNDYSRTSNKHYDYDGIQDAHPTTSTKQWNPESF